MGQFRVTLWVVCLCTVLFSSLALAFTCTGDGQDGAAKVIRTNVELLTPEAFEARNCHFEGDVILVGGTTAQQQQSRLVMVNCSVDGLFHVQGNFEEDGATQALSNSPVVEIRDNVFRSEVRIEAAVHGLDFTLRNSTVSRRVLFRSPAAQHHSVDDAGNAFALSSIVVDGAIEIVASDCVNVTLDSVTSTTVLEVVTSPTPTTAPASPRPLHITLNDANVTRGNMVLSGKFLREATVVTISNIHVSRTITSEQVFAGESSKFLMKGVECATLHFDGAFMNRSALVMEQVKSDSQVIFSGRLSPLRYLRSKIVNQARTYHWEVVSVGEGSRVVIDDCIFADGLSLGFVEHKRSNPDGGYYPGRTYHHYQTWISNASLLLVTSSRIGGNFEVDMSDASVFAFGRGNTFLASQGTLKLRGEHRIANQWDDEETKQSKWLSERAMQNGTVALFGERVPRHRRFSVQGVFVTCGIELQEVLHAVMITHVSAMTSAVREHVASILKAAEVESDAFDVSNDQNERGQEGVWSLADSISRGTLSISSDASYTLRNVTVEGQTTLSGDARNGAAIKVIDSVLGAGSRAAVLTIETVFANQSSLLVNRTTVGGNVYMDGAFHNDSSLCLVNSTFGAGLKFSGRWSPVRWLKYRGTGSPSEYFWGTYAFSNSTFNIFACSFGGDVVVGIESIPRGAPRAPQSGISLPNSFFAYVALSSKLTIRRSSFATALAIAPILHSTVLIGEEVDMSDAPFTVRGEEGDTTSSLFCIDALRVFSVEWTRLRLRYTYELHVTSGLTLAEIAHSDDADATTQPSSGGSGHQFAILNSEFGGVAKIDTDASMVISDLSLCRALTVNTRAKAALIEHVRSCTSTTPSTSLVLDGVIAESAQFHLRHSYFIRDVNVRALTLYNATLNFFNVTCEKQLQIEGAILKASRFVLENSTIQRGIPFLGRFNTASLQFVRRVTHYSGRFEYVWATRVVDDGSVVRISGCDIGGTIQVGVEHRAGGKPLDSASGTFSSQSKHSYLPSFGGNSSFYVTNSVISGNFLVELHEAARLYLGEGLQFHPNQTVFHVVGDGSGHPAIVPLLSLSSSSVSSCSDDSQWRLELAFLKLTDVNIDGALACVDVLFDTRFENLGISQTKPDDESSSENAAAPGSTAFLHSTVGRGLKIINNNENVSRSVLFSDIVVGGSFRMEGQLTGALNVTFHKCHFKSTTDIETVFYDGAMLALLESTITASTFEIDGAFVNGSSLVILDSHVATSSRSSPFLFGGRFSPLLSFTTKQLKSNRLFHYWEAPVFYRSTFVLSNTTLSGFACGGTYRQRGHPPGHGFASSWIHFYRASAMASLVLWEDVTLNTPRNEYSLRLLEDAYFDNSSENTSVFVFDTLLQNTTNFADKGEPAPELALDGNGSVVALNGDFSVFDGALVSVRSQVGMGDGAHVPSVITNQTANEALSQRRQDLIRETYSKQRRDVVVTSLTRVADMSEDTRQQFARLEAVFRATSRKEWALVALVPPPPKEIAQTVHVRIRELAALPSSSLVFLSSNSNNDGDELLALYVVAYQCAVDLDSPIVVVNEHSVTPTHDVVDSLSPDSVTLPFKRTSTSATFSLSLPSLTIPQNETTAPDDRREPSTTASVAYDVPPPPFPASRASSDPSVKLIAEVAPEEVATTVRSTESASRAVSAAVVGASMGGIPGRTVALSGLATCKYAGLLADEEDEDEEEQGAGNDDSKYPRPSPMEQPFNFVAVGGGRFKYYNGALIVNNIVLFCVSAFLIVVRKFKLLGRARARSLSAKAAKARRKKKRTSKKKKRNGNDSDSDSSSSSSSDSDEEMKALVGSRRNNTNTTTTSSSSSSSSSDSTDTTSTSTDTTTTTTTTTTNSDEHTDGDSTTQIITVDSASTSNSNDNAPKPRKRKSLNTLVAILAAFEGALHVYFWPNNAQLALQMIVSRRSSVLSRLIGTAVLFTTGVFFLRITVALLPWGYKRLTGAVQEAKNHVVMVRDAASALEDNDDDDEDGSGSAAAQQEQQQIAAFTALISTTARYDYYMTYADGVRDERSLLCRLYYAIEVGTAILFSLFIAVLPSSAYCVAMTVVMSVILVLYLLYMLLIHPLLDWREHWVVVLLGLLQLVMCVAALWSQMDEGEKGLKVVGWLNLVTSASFFLSVAVLLVCRYFDTQKERTLAYMKLAQERTERQKQREQQEKKKKSRGIDGEDHERPLLDTVPTSAMTPTGTETSSGGQHQLSNPLLRQRRQLIVNQREEEEYQGL